MKIKTFSIIILFQLLSGEVYSQTEKGTFALSGKTDLNFLFSNTTTDRGRRDSININSERTKNNKYGFTIGCGYFVADNLMVALSSAYSYAYTKTESGIYQPVGRETITSTLGVVPQLSYYFPLEGKLRPSLTIGAGYIWSKERDSRIPVNYNIVYSLTGPSYNAAAGLSYFINQSVAFDVGLQYSHNRLKDLLIPNDIQKQNVVAGALGVSIFF